MRLEAPADRVFVAAPHPASLRSEALTADVEVGPLGARQLSVRRALVWRQRQLPASAYAGVRQALADVDAILAQPATFGAADGATAGEKAP